MWIGRIASILSLWLLVRSAIHVPGSDIQECRIVLSTHEGAELAGYREAVEILYSRIVILAGRSGLVCVVLVFHGRRGVRVCLACVKDDGSC